MGIYALDIDDRTDQNTVSLINESIFGNVPSSDDGVYLGVSWNYDFSEVLQLQFRYDDFDVDVFSFGVKYRLGR